MGLANVEKEDSSFEIFFPFVISNLYLFISISFLCLQHHLFGEFAALLVLYNIKENVFENTQSHYPNRTTIFPF